MNKKNNAIRQATILLMGSILVSRIIGFFREWILARSVGASSETDVYYASFTIPDFLNYTMATGALSISLIPILSQYQSESRGEDSRRLFRTLATYFGGMMLVLILIAEYFATPLSRIIAPGFDEAQIELLTKLLRIILPAQLFFYLGGLATSVFHIHGRFLLPALSPILYNLSIIAVGVLLPGGVTSFSWGVLLGSVLGHGLLLAYGLKRLGYSFLPHFRLSRADKEGLRRYFSLSFPIMLGFSLVVTDEWIAKFLASELEPKLLSWLSYARTEMRIPVAVIGQAAGIASFPFLSRRWAERNFKGYTESLILESQKLWALSTLAAIFFYIEAIPITRFIYGGGKLGSADLLGIASALEVYSVGIFFWTFQILLSRAFYASGRTWLPSIIGTVLSVFLFPLYSHLMERYSYVGLAWAGTLGVTLYGLLLSIFLFRHVLKVCPELSIRRMATFFFSWGLVSSGLGAAIYFVRQSQWFEPSQIGSFLEITVVLSVIVFISWFLLRRVFVRLTGEPLF